MSNKIKVTLHHYLDENDKIMSREELNRRIVSLQKDNEKLKKCAEFYANKDNWEGANPNWNKAGFICEDLEKFPPSENLRIVIFYGGKLARQTLKEITAENSEVENDSNN